MKSASESLPVHKPEKVLKRHGTKFLQFCIVGGSGVFVDIGIFGFLADPHFLGLHITSAKSIAASTAMFSNFVLNEFWTFRESRENHGTVSEITNRLLKFCAICSIGIVVAICLLNLFVRLLELNIHLANFLAIIIAAVWNYAINAKLNWKLR